MILFYISLGLGVIHLSLSYLMAVFQSYSRSEQLQKLGLLGVLWGGVCLISQRIWFSDPSMMLSKWFYYGGLSFLACGLLLTFLFASDSKKIATRLGLGLWSIYGLTGLVGDLLSYARLFGLGIATTAIASVMNDLAGMVHKAAGTFVGAILLFLFSFSDTLSIFASLFWEARSTQRDFILLKLSRVFSRVEVLNINHLKWKGVNDYEKKRYSDHWYFSIPYHVLFLFFCLCANRGSK